MKIKINEPNYAWRGSLTIRKRTNFIVLHHAAISKASHDDIHRSHLNKGWSGIGYHFYVRKNGNIYRGRPINTVGAHCSGYNAQSVGVCFEGNFEGEKMPLAQLESGALLISYLRDSFKGAGVKKHSQLCTTACPGRNFPFNDIAYSAISETDDIVRELYKRNIMTNPSLWLSKCKKGSNAYYLALKICNMTKNEKRKAALIDGVNDIVWELSHRGIITDKALWLKLLREDTDLYFLAYKACNLTKNKEGD